ncbi:rhomboid family intramembrane serine protease [Stratiformator vulcanicus]|uniref:Rhomboid protease GluP n=1 Tax=Stratiformator vulcanicus TaxID=2527980 RepID=A0A517QYG3_9PLAN|nr:rhomboid family intramembrane serine protease [Stratiformator vulcanicus]QDT36696.1 Rhomboid protease GluP [Stratiformator vulcanicus]
MFPLYDDIKSRRTPIVNYAIVGLCTVMFLFQLASPTQLVDELAMIPERISDPTATIEIPVERVMVDTPEGPKPGYRFREANPAIVPAWLTPLTCIFLHGGWMHIIGNLWFLIVFGDNVEDRFGHLGFLIFYLGCGVAASLSHLISAPHSMTPTVGASGAIAGVMGAYMMLYPGAKVFTLVPIFFIIQILVLPAPFFLGIWFVMQLLEGTASIGQTTGVAWWAHIGGFAVGAIAAWVMKITHLAKPPVQERRAGSGRFRNYQGNAFRRGDRR